MEHFDVCVIGSGSGNSIIDERFAGKRIALVDAGERFGGTCLLAGCLPTKIFVHTADIAVQARDAGRFGLTLPAPVVDWPSIRDRVFGRIDPISEAGLAWRLSDPSVTLFRGTARFTGVRTLAVTLAETGDEVGFTADQVVLAAGSRPYHAPIEGFDAPELAGRIHTSDTIMRIERLPRRMVILGGGAVAAEFAHIFSALGVRVTVVNRSEPLLRHEDGEVAALFTELLSHRVTVRLRQVVREVETDDHGGIVVVTTDSDGIEYAYEADLLLVAQGRVPNSDTLDLEATGVAVAADGYVVVDEHQRTTCPGVYALGDISNRHQLKHVANHEARVVQHNLGHPDDLVSADHRFVPRAVFSSPQLAAVGATEEELVASGRPFLKGVQRYGDVGYGWALEDTDHIAKVLVDPTSLQLLGVHILGPEAATLIQPAIQAMATGLDARTMARGQYWIHPALTEVLENALLQVAPDPR